MRKVEVSPYNEQWGFMFEEEADKLRGIFGKQLEDIYHIGSTSVPGLASKTIIDIMPVVSDIGLVDTYNHQMRNLGYEPKGENGIPGRRYFQKGGDNRTHHIEQERGTSRFLSSRWHLSALAHVTYVHSQSCMLLPQTYSFFTT